ncbi:Aldehyde/histidinol dehydrogenase [Dactylonectria estremocensis]|uniref:aldehyde dehydrogenase (NAD(+)) n=1 Tax=Dactylonectria estremocensis TaxID=1079267 RepID=A0A9P9J218_9HYPO|nr:Aldehyde/histidinol dehydrogenase [Dactylonectria estremocensis]
MGDLSSQLRPSPVATLSSSKPAKPTPSQLALCAEAGNALSLHMDIRKIKFPGSIEVGKLIQVAEAKSNLKCATLELGGKSLLINFPDANRDKALPSATLFLLVNSKGCALPTRLYVHEYFADEFAAKLKTMVEARAQSLGGDPTLAITRSSPLCHYCQRNVVFSYIDAGNKEAALLIGGKPFSSEDEVVKVANDTEFELAAYVWTADINGALRLSQKLEAETISVNEASSFHPSAPMGGWKLKITDRVRDAGGNPDAPGTVDAVRAGDKSGTP